MDNNIELSTKSLFPMIFAFMLLLHYVQLQIMTWSSAFTSPLYTNVAIFLVLANHLKAKQAATLSTCCPFLFHEVFKPRRAPRRKRIGWQNSQLYVALQAWDEEGFQRKFRLTREAFNMVCRELEAAGTVQPNRCRAQKYRVTVEYKVAVAIYFLAHGCSFQVMEEVTGLSPVSACAKHAKCDRECCV